MIQGIEELKKITCAKNVDFPQCFNLFLDLTENDHFINASQKFSGNEVFFDMLLRPVRNIFREDVHISSSFLMRMKKHKLIHGTLMLSNHQMLTLYYFEDIECGLAAASNKEGKASFIRITILQTITSTTKFLWH